MELVYDSHNTIIQPVFGMSEARLGCHYVRQLANELDFKDVQREQLFIAAREITSNLVVHKAIEPCLSIYRVSQPDRTGITLVATDHGPGIPSINQAMADHHSTAGSMGCGLGAIRRLMDDFAIQSAVPQPVSKTRQSYTVGGTTLVASKWCRLQDTPPATFHWGGISRPKLGYVSNGDAYFMAETADDIHIIVVDGLGHGKEAEIASQIAISTVKTNLDMPYAKLFPLLHTSLRGSRGVALMAIRLDKVNRLIHYCGVGNIEATILPQQTSTPQSRPGVLGSGILPALLINTLPWPLNGVLILHSDGVSRRWRTDPLIQQHMHKPLLLSHLLLRDYGRYTDDATVFILQEKTRHV